MAVLRALQVVPRTLRRNPVLFVPIVVVVAVQLPALALQRTNPLLSSFVASLVFLGSLAALPFVHAGLVAMVDEALDGRTSLATFRRAGRANYVSVLGATLLLVLVVLGLGVVVFLGAVAAFVILLALRADAALLFLVVVGLSSLAFVGFLVVLFFVQFYGQVIVLEDRGAVEGLQRSVALVRRHLPAALGYTLLVAVGTGVVGLLFSVASLLLTPSISTVIDLPLSAVGGGLVLLGVLTLVGTLAGGIFATYSVVFYRVLCDRASPDRTSSTRG